MAADAGHGRASPLALTGDAAFRGPDVGGGVLLPNGDGGATKTSFLDFGGGFVFAAVEGVTVAAWVRFDSFQNAGTILDLRDADDSNRIRLQTYGTTRRARWHIKNEGTTKHLDTPAAAAGQAVGGRGFS